MEYRKATHGELMELFCQPGTKAYQRERSRRWQCEHLAKQGKSTLAIMCQVYGRKKA